MTIDKSLEKNEKLYCKHNQIIIIIPENDRPICSICKEPIKILSIKQYDHLIKKLEQAENEIKEWKKQSFSDTCQMAGYLKEIEHLKKENEKLKGKIKCKTCIYSYIEMGDEELLNQGDKT